LVSECWYAISSQTDTICSIIGLDPQPRVFGWILNVSNAPFPVDIGKGMTVGELKEEIKKKFENGLRTIDADTLGLWKVGKSSPCGSMTSDFQEAISTHSFCRNQHEA
jgi:hypothetical protein